MDDQIAGLVSSQYGSDLNTQQTFLRSLFESEYQRDRCIRIVALDREKVIGFQSYLYWPYLLEGRTLNTYQSGNSLVHQDYRGRGVFAALLKFIDKHPELRTGIDFIMGFPVDASFDNFLLNKWSNILDLDWFIRPLLFLPSVRRNERKNTIGLNSTRIEIPEKPFCKGLELNWDGDFHSWRTSLTRKENYYYYHYLHGSKCVRFDLKQKSRGWMSELIIGRVTTNSRKNDFLTNAVRELVRTVAKERVYSYISFAYNSLYFDTSIMHALRHCCFFPIRRHIHFIVKNFECKVDPFRPELWELFRSDIDTW